MNVWSAIRKLDSGWEVLAERLTKACAANFDNLRTVSKSALKERVSAIADDRIREVKRAIGYALGWDELMDS